MTRRPGSPPSRLGLVARLAATAAVAAGATAGAVLVHWAPAHAAGQGIEAASSTAGAAEARAQQLLDGFSAPPGASRLPGAPSNAPASANSPVTAMMPYTVTKTAWWHSGQSGSALIAWIDQHPEQGLTTVYPDLQTSGVEAPSATLSGPPTPVAPDGVTVYVTAYPLADGSTGLRVVAVVGYVPPRPTSERIPASSSLIAVPAFPLGSKESAPEVTLTDPVEIAEVENIINTLPKAPSGAFCPFDNGAGIALDFENAQGATLADVVVGAGGCGDVQVSIAGYDEPALGGGRQAAAQIQAILGTHWDLTQP